MWIKIQSPDGKPNRKQYLKIGANRCEACQHMNEVFSNITKNFTALIHWGMLILKIEESENPFEVVSSPSRNNFQEPTYQEKLSYLKEVGIWKKIAFEVMPKKKDIVDKADVYHMFEIPDSNQFRYDILPIFSAPEVFTTDENYEYAIKTIEDVDYLYLRRKDGRELRWWDKQKLKDKILGEDRYAVEIIIQGMENKSYTALIVLPKYWSADFTIIST